MEHVPVLIVGGGPTGLALSGDLGWRGTSNLLIERTDGRVEQPRQDMVGIRTMEFCRRWGIVDWVESAGYNRGYVQDCAWVTNLNGHEFGREPFPAPQDEHPGPLSPQTRERCPQNFFDPVLARFARRSCLAELRYRTELLSVEQDDDRAVAHLRDLESDVMYDVSADYVVGADGGSSRVRTELGITMEGDGVLTYTTNAVFRCADLEALHTTKPAYRYIFIGPEGTWATLVAINGADQWRFSLVGDQTPRKVTEQEMRTAITRAVGRDFDFEILSMLPWIRRQLVAESYGSGRIFVAGDAAHLTSPTGGFGMNTGVLDAVNLSWKLSAVLEGWGGADLVASYEVEQHPVAVRNVTEAGDNLKRMLSPRVAVPDPRVFDDTDPASDQARREYGQRYTDMMRREWFSVGIHLGYVYEGSPIIVPDGSPKPEDSVSTYRPSARPGSRAPHAWLAPDYSILDGYGHGFTLVRFDRSTDVSALKRAATTTGLPLRVLDVESAETSRLYERRLVLVRPDGTVAWRADDEPADALAVIDTVRGAGEVPSQTWTEPLNSRRLVR